MTFLTIPEHIRFANDFHGIGLPAIAAGSSFMPIMYVILSIKSLSRFADAVRILERRFTPLTN